MYAYNIKIVCITIMEEMHMPVNSFEDYPMSWKPVLEKNSHEPMYLALANRLEEDIRQGVLSPGTKLPPQRELADYLDVNISTITRAFRLCEERSLICGAVGRGTFIASDAGSQKSRFGIPSAPAVIEMGAILPEEAPGTQLVEQLKVMLQEPGSYHLFQYATPEQNQNHLQAAVKWLAFSGMHAEPEEILFAAGGQNAIFAVLAGVFSPGDRIATTPSSYPGFKLAAKALHIQPVALNMREGVITREALEFAVKHENVKGLYLIPDFNNPTAETMSEEERKVIGEFLTEYELPLIEDSINTLLMSEPGTPVSAYTRQGIYLSSMSKALSPGLRLAVIRADKAYYQAISQSLYAMNISPPSMMVHLAARLIHSGKAQEIRAQRQKGIVERNLILEDILTGYELKGTSQSPMRWLMLPEGLTGDLFEHLALKAGVQVYSASRFCVGATPVPAAVRLAVTAVTDTEVFRNGAFMLRTILEEYGKVNADILL